MNESFRLFFRKEKKGSPAQHSGVVGAARKAGKHVDERHVRIVDPLEYDGVKLLAIVTPFVLRGCTNTQS